MQANQSPLPSSQVASSERTINPVTNPLNALISYACHFRNFPSSFHAGHGTASKQTTLFQRNQFNSPTTRNNFISVIGHFTSDNCQPANATNFPSNIKQLATHAQFIRIADSPQTPYQSVSHQSEWPSQTSNESRLLLYSLRPFSINMSSSLSFSIATSHLTIKFNLLPSSTTKEATNFYFIITHYTNCYLHLIPFI